MNRSVSYLLRASCAALMAASCSAAMAQDMATVGEAGSPPVEADQSGIDDIIVTAQFRGQRIQDTPLAITAMSGEALEARGQVSVLDIGSFTPSVNLSTAAATQSNSVSAFIRGIGQDDSNFALEPGVGIYIDDVYFGTTFGASLDLVDLDRAEILRGPQGTLAGKNSLGGAIKLYSRKPDETPGGMVQVGYGRFDRVDVRGSANIPLSESLFTRFSAVYRRDDGYFKELDYGCVNPGQGIAATGRADGNCVLGRAGGENMLTLRGAIRFAPVGSPLEINIIGDYSRDHRQPVAGKIQYADNPLVRSYDAGNPAGGIPFDSRFLTPKGSYTSYADYGDGGNFSTVYGTLYQQAPGSRPYRRKNTADGWGVSGTIDYRLGDSFSLKSITAYRSVDGTSVIDIDGSPLNMLLESLRNKHEQFTQELRLSGSVGTAVDFTVGGFYYKADDLLQYYIGIPQFLFDYMTDDPVSNRSIAGFAHAEFHATDKLNIIGGIRYTDDKKTYTFVRTNYDGSPISGIPLTPSFTVADLDGVSATYSGSRWDYRLGINYAWNDRIMTYAQVATGYKGGGINPRPFVSDQVTNFEPETLITYEAGFKTSFLNGRVVMNGSAFYNDYKDIQRTVYVCLDSVSTTCGKPVNAGDGRSYGAEFEMFLRPARGWQINGSVSWLNFKYKSINPLTAITLDMAAPFANEVMASLGVQYEADLGGAGRLTPRFDVSYQSEFYTQPVNNAVYNMVPERALANARLTYETADGNWGVTASVTNLFDKYYAVSKTENIVNFGIAQSILGRPREWMLSLTRRF
ncbi:MAG: TonB-dependent receptor [Sphingobium sp. 32-64-5]|nr:MAG: TonB-dependent receptor [Sphingobium sp. 32-64-5]